MSFERYKADIDRLVRQGNALNLAMMLTVYPEVKEEFKKEQVEKLPKFNAEYQSWYSEALTCIKQLLPARVDDFVAYYKASRTRKNLDVENYTISDYLRGLSGRRFGDVIVGPDAAVKPLEQQVRIVESLKKR